MPASPSLSSSLRVARQDLREDLRACAGGSSFGLFVKHLFNPGFQVSCGYRLSRALHLAGWNRLAHLAMAAARLVTGSEIHFRAKLEGGVVFPHGRGVVVGPGVEIGRKCSIFHNVTLGGSERRPGSPVLEEGVNVYPSSVVAGDVRVGEYSRVGPCVYLTESVPSHTRVRPAPPLMERKVDMAFDYDRHIRKVKDFPKPGILFYDVTSLMASPEAFARVQEDLDRLVPPGAYDALLAIESRGFLFAAVAAYRHKKPVFLARKPGKLPNPTVSRAYTLEYGQAALEIQKVDLEKKGRWLVVDDLIATGGTLEATCAMLKENGIAVAGVFAVIGLPFLDFRKRLAGLKVHTLVDYDHE